mmetsp:Transcript_61949/g.134219  ORF Transcript_61949/g.134219 Transcript_61949/m.134219 type:complete len:232 (-) Transcript_61949:1563-2258(-)
MDKISDKFDNQDGQDKYDKLYNNSVPHSPRDHDNQTEVEVKKAYNIVQNLSNNNINSEEEKAKIKGESSNIFSMFGSLFKRKQNDKPVSVSVTGLKTQSLKDKDKDKVTVVDKDLSSPIFKNLNSNNVTQDLNLSTSTPTAIITNTTITSTNINTNSNTNTSTTITSVSNVQPLTTNTNTNTNTNTTSISTTNPKVTAQIQGSGSLVNSEVIQVQEVSRLEFDKMKDLFLN